MSGTRVVLEGPGKFDYVSSDLRAEWKRWKRGFNSWLIGAEQDAKKEPVKVNLLLTLLGSDGQDIFETFQLDEEQPKLAQVLEQFDSHFAGLSNVTMARFRFFSFAQGRKSVTDFVTGLKSLANDCEFGDLKDSLVKDMIVINCSSEKLREQLLKEPKLNLAKAVEVARIGEDAMRNVEAISREVAEEGSAGALVAGRRGTQQRRGLDFRRPWKFDGDCFECGEYGHMARDCPEREKGTSNRLSGRETTKSDKDTGQTRKSYAGYAASWALGATMEGGGRRRWYVDSGASKHMTWKRESFEWYEPYRKPRTVKLGDGKTVRAYGQGDMKLRVRAAGGAALVTMTQVQFVPKLRMSLLSVPSTTKVGNEVMFQAQACVVSCGSLRLRCAVNRGGLYEVPILDEPGGDRTGPQSNTGYATSGGVMMKSTQRGGRTSYDSDTGAGANRCCSGTSGNQVGGASRFQESPDTRTQTGGQGYPGASTYPEPSQDRRPGLSRRQDPEWNVIGKIGR